MFGDDRIQIRILRDALQCDVGDCLVSEATNDAGGFVLKLEEIVLRR
jgi:hypothetical protein